MDKAISISMILKLKGVIDKIVRSNIFYNTSGTQTTRVWHEWKDLILITTQVKTYFHTIFLAILQMKDYKERNNFVLTAIFW